MAGSDPGRVTVQGRRAVVLLSGGLDSYTAAAIVKAEGFVLHALTIHYGQRHEIEVQSARRVARALGVAQHLELALDLRSIGGSALTSDAPVPVDRGPGAQGIPSTYVPARNSVFLSLALGFAEVCGASDLVIGVNAVDYSGYPDCRPDFIRAFEALANLATRAGIEGARFRVHTPLVELSKADIIRRGLALGLDYGLTHSCYDPDAEGRPCRRCESCAIRARGFAEAGVADPLMAGPRS
ncbi:MAG: 7-cyano-7-deazaguanine synthase QueC [Vicinamibacterales bacterium]